MGFILFCSIFTRIKLKISYVKLVRFHPFYFENMS